MKRLSIVLSVALVSAASVAQPEKKAAPRVSAITRLGGRVVKPGSQKGKIAVIDAQSRVAASNFLAVAQNVASYTKLNVVYEKAAPGEAAKLKAASAADFAVVVVDDETTPAMLVAPEDGWAVVNVAKVGRNLKSAQAMEKFFVGRCRREVIRAFSLLCGGGSSAYPGNVMNAAKLEDVDKYDEGIPHDMIMAYTAYLANYGVTPKIEAVYAKACREGWAPRPTNDVQKAIWERVHAVPDKPIKITFDPKRDK